MAIAPYQQAPITLSQDDYWLLIHDAAGEQTVSTADPLNITWSYPSQWGKGYVRDIHLQDGLVVSIIDYCPYHDLMLSSSDREHPLELTYILAGVTSSSVTSPQAGQYIFCGSGMAPGAVCKQPANQRRVEVSIHIDVALLCQWMNGTADQFPPTLKPSR
ncbi:MAG: hypothetical protein HC879_06700 [Leptolyngbyaceae cyanobacterium SL_5_9]|nr:hypothetical protein [Leptolyngbyaceae cyanobacterium SL_5_9]NJO73388.1 hypothetical protein [Leptolyngbyaceae cyanobacterium RM1_406_9]